MYANRYSSMDTSLGTLIEATNNIVDKLEKSRLLYPKDSNDMFNPDTSQLLLRRAELV